MYFFPKTVTLLILAQAQSAVPPAASLRRLLLFRFVVFHYDMTTWNLLQRSFFFKVFKAFSAKQQKKKAKVKRNHYSVIEQNAYIYGKYYKMFVSENDRSKWLVRREFDRSSPPSGWTLSVDRLLFWALQVKFFEEFKLQKNCEINLLIKTFLGLVDVMFGLVNVSFSLPEWQAVTMTFFAPCYMHIIYLNCRMKK